MKIKSIEIEWEDGQRTVFTSPLLGRIELEVSAVVPDTIRDILSQALDFSGLTP
jgi:hypothetical protein